MAIKQIQEAGKTDWVEFGLTTFLTALWYAFITCVIMMWGYGITNIDRDLSYLRDRVDVIQYNQTIDGAKFTPWDMKEFHEAWDKRNQAFWEQRNKNGQK